VPLDSATSNRHKYVTSCATSALFIGPAERFLKKNLVSKAFHMRRTVFDESKRMQKARFTETQIVAILTEAES